MGGILWLVGWLAGWLVGWLAEWDLSPNWLSRKLKLCDFCQALR